MCRPDPVPARWHAVRLGIQLKELARDVGCTPEHLSNVLNCRTRASVELRQKVAYRLGMSTEEAFTSTYETRFGCSHKAAS